MTDSRLGRALNWTWRGILALIGTCSLLWFGAFLIGSCRLESKLKEVAADTRLTWKEPKNWMSPGSGENGGPYFTAAFALAPSQAGGVLRINQVLNGKWTDIPEPERDKLRAWVARGEKAFELASLGAKSPWCRFHRTWDPGSERTAEWGLRYPLLWFLITRAWVHFSGGRHHEVRNTIRVAFAVADCIRDDPFLESQMARMAGHQMVMKSVLSLVPASPSGSELDEWLDIVPASGFLDECLEPALRWRAHALSELLGGPLSRFWEEWARHVPRHRRYEKGFRRRLADPLVKSDGVRALDDLMRIRDLVQKPYVEARVVAGQMEAEARARSSAWNPVRANFSIWPRYVLDEIQMTRSMCVVIRTGLEWEKSRLTNGKYPESCNVIDPLSGSPFILKTDPFRLTSGGNVHHLTHGAYYGPPTWVLRRK